MIDSRKLEDLDPEFLKMIVPFIADYEMETGNKLCITSTKRDNEMQAFLYSKGRSAPGKIVTNARPGWSFHNYSRALDAYPMIGGKILFETDRDHNHILDHEWQDYGRIAVKHGLVWAGNWTGTLKEYPHVQMPGITIEQLQQELKTHE